MWSLPGTPRALDNCPPPYSYVTGARYEATMCVCCVGGQAPLFLTPESELLSSQKERQWSLPACSTRAGNIFGNLRLSELFILLQNVSRFLDTILHLSQGILQTKDADSGPWLLTTAGGALCSPIGLWNMPHPVHPVTSHPWH